MLSHIVSLKILQAEPGGTYSSIKTIRVFIFNYQEKINKSVHPTVSFQQVFGLDLLSYQRGSLSFTVKTIISRSELST